MMVIKWIAAIKNRPFTYDLTATAPFLAFAVVFFSGAGLDVLNIDEAQYAEISREMALSANWLKVYELGKDYLDKPPLLFWLSAIMFKLFGVSSFSYRLLPILLSSLGIYSLWRFVLLYYNVRAAYFAALIWTSTFALLAMNRDVRTDNFLTTFVIFSIWQLAAYLETDRLKYLVGGSIGIGLSMLAKGPIGLIVPILAFSGQFITGKTYRLFFKTTWLIALGIIGLMLTPMCIGLYQQYGGRGLYFYFWLQSFGRITGENEWNNHAPITFQATNFLWSFQPWVFPFIFALFALFRNKIYDLRALRFWDQKPDKVDAFHAGSSKGTEEIPPGTAGGVNFKMNENIAMSGFLLTFVALSTSHYQLPHYTFVVFPLAAAITGVYFDYLVNQHRLSSSFILLDLFQSFLLVAAFCSIGYLIMVCFPKPNLPTISFLVLSFIFIVILLSGLYINRKIIKRNIALLVAGSFITIFTIGLLLNTYIFPKIYSYQADGIIGKTIKKDLSIPLERLLVYSAMHGDNKELDFHALCFNAGYIFPLCKRYDEVAVSLKTGENWVYTDEDGIRILKEKGYEITYLKQAERFHVSMLTKGFLFPFTRAKAVQLVYLIKIFH